VAAIGVIVTVVLVVSTAAVHNGGKQRLLRQRRERPSRVDGVRSQHPDAACVGRRTVEVTNGTDQQGSSG
jgi:hypothetical protein